MQKPPIQVVPGTRQAVTTSLKIAFEQLELNRRQLRDTNGRVEQLVERLTQLPADETGINWQRDVAVLSSILGGGRVVRATLLAEAYELLRRRDYAALRCLSGVAPVTRRFGKSCIVVQRLACNQRLQNALYHWARTAKQHDKVSKAKYSRLRDRGHSHARSPRSVRDRLLKVACSMLENQEEFDPQRGTFEKAA